MSTAPSVLTDLPTFDELVAAPDRAPFPDEPQVIRLDLTGAVYDPDLEAASLEIPGVTVEAPEPQGLTRGWLRWLTG